MTRFNELILILLAACIAVRGMFVLYQLVMAMAGAYV